MDTHRRTPLHAWQESHAARFADRHGWRLPAAFADTSREVNTARTGLAIADVTAFAKFSFTGADVASLARSWMSDPQAGKIAAVKEPASGWLCYLSEDTLLLLCTDLATGRMGPPWRDVTDAHAGFLVIGDNAPQFLGSHLDLGADPNVIAPGACLETGIFGVQCILARPAAELPAIGVWVGWDVARFVWDRLCETGSRHGLAPIGIDALKELDWHA
jgi:glycine cleavage system aminomethyltransferase T